MNNTFPQFSNSGRLVYGSWVGNNQEDNMVIALQVTEGIKAKRKGIGESVDFDSSAAPIQFCCADWLNIIDGLTFVTSSPGTVRDISFVDVQVGQNTDEAVLKGFCCLLESLNSKKYIPAGT